MHALARWSAAASFAAVVAVCHGPHAIAHLQTALASDCVTIGKPGPSVGYTYEHTESTGGKSQYTSRWEEVTAAGSRVRTTRAGGTVVQVNEHHIVDDVMVLDRSTQLNGNGGVDGATAFRPGLVGDPAFRACAGRSWPIPPVTATYQSSQTTASSPTPPGTLRIIAINEKMTVPAGTFNTVHYVRTSQSTDE
jgi:hypothetical protein